MSAKTNNKYQKQTAIKMIKKLIFALVIGASNSALAQVSMVKMQPACGAQDVNIDTHLELTLSDTASIGQKGFISVYDKQSGKLVDRLDLSIPAGPTQ